MAGHSPPAPPFDPEQAINAVKYEYDMALATAVLLSNNVHDSAAAAFAVLESFLVHLRNLNEFFLPRNDKQIQARKNPRSFSHGSIWALDFVEGFGRRTLEPEVVETINRRLQHLTTWRQLENPGWQPSLLKEVYLAMDEFFVRVDEDSRQRLLQTHKRVTTLLQTVGLVDAAE